MKKIAFAPIVFLLSAGLVTAADNPEFANWNAYGQGTSIAMKTTSSFSGMTSVSTMTTTLIEKTADKLVLETVVETEVMGNKFKAPATKRDVPKTIDLPAGKPGPEAGKPDEGTRKEGEETVKVAGGEFKSKWNEYTTADKKTVTKVWHSDDVPGKVVKMSSKGDQVSTTMELVEFKKK